MGASGALVRTLLRGKRGAMRALGAGEGRSASAASGGFPEVPCRPGWGQGEAGRFWLYIGGGAKGIC